MDPLGNWSTPHTSWFADGIRFTAVVSPFKHTCPTMGGPLVGAVYKVRSTVYFSLRA